MVMGRVSSMISGFTSTLIIPSTIATPMAVQKLLISTPVRMDARINTTRELTKSMVSMANGFIFEFSKSLRNNIPKVTP